MKIVQSVRFLKVAVFFAFIAQEWLQKSILTMFVNYQELVGLDQLEVLRDRYQMQEKIQLATTKSVKIIIATICTLLAIACFLPQVDSFRVEIVASFTRTVVLLFTLKILIPTYYQFFKILMERRKYEFKKFHGSHEITLAIAIVICLLFHIFGSLNDLYLSCWKI